MKYRQALQKAMSWAMERFDHTVIIGQGVDDHKGIFGTTSHLIEQYGAERVVDTPLAEDSVMGISLGMSLQGLYPIQTHIRSDFLLLGANQLINMIAKYRYMFGGLYQCPMLIRCVIGRSWGQGAQHSQSLQSLLAHIPGLTVIMPASADSISTNYQYVISEYRNPVVSFEHRLMYELDFTSDNNVQSLKPLASYLVRQGKDVTIAATSIMVLEAKRAADYLQQQHGIECEIIDLNCISHLDNELILTSVAKTRRLVVADTSWLNYGVCAELSRLICAQDPRLLTAAVGFLGMQNAPCPTAKTLEDAFYPRQTEVIKTIFHCATGEKLELSALERDSMTDYYKHFKGPF